MGDSKINIAANPIMAHEEDLKFSVITPSLNQGSFIGQTIESVLAQGYGNYEHIIYDGGSSDETLEILGNYPSVDWISEPDSGQSNALNKALAKSTGEIIAWINSDDWYAQKVFHTVNAFFKVNPTANVVMGDCVLVRSDGEVIEEVHNYARDIRQLRKYWIKNAIPTQPTVFFRTELLNQFGKFDESLHFAMDYDFWLRIAEKNKFFHIDQVFAYYRWHPDAKGGTEDWSQFVKEWKLVYKHHTSLLSRTADLGSKLLVKATSLLKSCFKS